MPDSNRKPVDPLRADGSLRHLLTLEGLPPSVIRKLLERSEHYARPLSKAAARSDALAGRTVAVMFAEPSTRTRVSFELAARRLGADVINIEVQLSFVLRDADAAVPDLVAAHVSEHVSVLSGGAGSYAHPTQGLLDALTVQQHKGRIEGLRIAIVGDIKHSRVARSSWHAFAALGAAEIRIVAPSGLMPVATS